MTATVPSSDMGMASTTLSVLDSEPRNIQHTSAVSSAGQQQLELDLVDAAPR